MTTRHILHLYLRAGFGVGYHTLTSLKSDSKSEIISKLFSDANKTLPLEIELSELRNQFLANFKNGKLKSDKKTIVVLQKMSREKIQELNYAWINRLNNPQSVLTEKMTLFWANVFVCRDNNVFDIQQHLTQLCFGRF